MGVSAVGVFWVFHDLYWLIQSHYWGARSLCYIWLRWLVLLGAVSDSAQDAAAADCRRLVIRSWVHLALWFLPLDNCLGKVSHWRLRSSHSTTWPWLGSIESSRSWHRSKMCRLWTQQLRSRRRRLAATPWSDLLHASRLSVIMVVASKADSSKIGIIGDSALTGHELFDLDWARLSSWRWHISLFFQFGLVPLILSFVFQKSLSVGSGVTHFSILWNF